MVTASGTNTLCPATRTVLLQSVHFRWDHLRSDLAAKMQTCLCATWYAASCLVRTLSLCSSFLSSAEFASRRRLTFCRLATNCQAQIALLLRFHTTFVSGNMREGTAVWNVHIPTVCKYCWITSRRSNYNTQLKVELFVCIGGLGLLCGFRFGLCKFVDLIRFIGGYWVPCLALFLISFRFISVSLFKLLLVCNL